MLNNLNSKKKIIIIVGMVLLVSASILLYSIKTYQKNVLSNMEMNYSKSMKDSYTKILEQNRIFYVNRIKANLRSKTVIPNFVNEKKEALYKNIKPRWNILSKENQYLKEMNFYKPNTGLFLSIADDTFKANSNLLAKVNDIKSIYYTFEKYKSDIINKVFVPITDDTKYQGLAEISISAKQIIIDMKYYNNLNGALFIKDDDNKFSLLHNTIKNNSLVDLLSNNEHKFNNFEQIQLNNKIYNTFAFTIRDHNDITIAHAVFFHDITNIIYEFDNEIEQVIYIILLLVVLVWIVIHFSFESIINTLENNNKKLKSNLTLMDQHIISSSTDLKGIITDASNAFCSISGYSKKELIGKPHSLIRHKDMDKKDFENLWIRLNNNKTWVGEIKNKKKDDSYYWVKATISPVFEKSGEKIGYTAIRQDITSKKLMEEISITDSLTNIFNRRHFDTLFPKIISTSKRKNDLVCLIMMDIDHFKQYNDTYGHQMGDTVLINLSKKLKDMLKRSEDYSFRVGGEEFAIIFKIEEKENALLFANKIKREIENLKMEHSGNSVSKYITVSMGLSCMNARDIKSPEELYKNTDDLLYKAKESGRNKVCSNF